MDSSSPMFVLWLIAWVGKRLWVKLPWPKSLYFAIAGILKSQSDILLTDD
jgi:hypothetical protein